MAGAVYNVHRKKGTTPIQPIDFIEGSQRPVHYVDGETLRDKVRGWLGRKH